MTKRSETSGRRFSWPKPSRVAATLTVLTSWGVSGAEPPADRPSTIPSHPAPVFAHDGTLRIGDATVSVELPAGRLPVPASAVRRWVGTAATAVTGYYGRFPVKRARLRVALTNRGRVHGGTTYDGRFIQIHLGRDVREADLADDWMLTHEMFHLGFPDLDESYHWMEEGLSDYLEPLARARIGDLSPEKVWAGFVEGMPQGQPEAGDEGLDRTHTWGRTYWGGCTYWLLADVRIREQTANRRSLDDAIRAILNAGGDGSEHWQLSRVLEVGDHATGTTALKDLHDQLGPKPVTIDLDALWSRLGVRGTKGHVAFDDRAPLAETRRSITRAALDDQRSKGPLPTGKTTPFATPAAPAAPDDTRFPERSLHAGAERRERSD